MFKEIEQNEILDKKPHMNLGTEHAHLMTTIPLKSTVLLGPLHKYKWYGSFPRKFLLHIFIVCVSVWLAFFSHRKNATLFEPQIVVFFQQFLNPGIGDYQQLTGDYSRNRAFFDVDKLQEFINTSVKTYFDISEPNTNSIFASTNTSDLRFGQLEEDPLVYLDFKDKFLIENIDHNIPLSFTMQRDNLGRFQDKHEMKILL